MADIAIVFKLANELYYKLPDTKPSHLTLEQFNTQRTLVLDVHMWFVRAIYMLRSVFQERTDVYDCEFYEVVNGLRERLDVVLLEYDERLAYRVPYAGINSIDYTIPVLSLEPVLTHYLKHVPSPKDDDSVEPVKKPSLCVIL